MNSKSDGSHIETPNLDQTIQKMDYYIQLFAQEGDTRERFLLMYRTFKNELRKNLQSGRFIDAGWSEAICCRMAQMYFEAYEAYQNGVEQCPESWQICFDATLAGQTNLMQDALMGMNAHINYDLTVCVYDVMEQNGDFKTIRQATNGQSVVDRRLNSLLKKRYFDYLLINQIAWESIPIIQDVLTARFSTFLGLMNKLTFRFSRAIVEKLILDYRDRAWTHALLLLSAEEVSERKNIRAFMDELAVGNTHLIQKFLSYNPLKFVQPALWPHLLEQEADRSMNPVIADLLHKKLKRRETAEYAARTFVEYGQTAVPYLHRMLKQEPDNRALSKQIYRILGQIGGREAAQLLADRLKEEKDPPHILYKSILKLANRDIALSFATQHLQKNLKNLLSRIATSLQVAEDLSIFSDNSLVQRTLRERREEARMHLKMSVQILQLQKGSGKGREKVLNELLSPNWTKFTEAALLNSKQEILKYARKLSGLQRMQLLERIRHINAGDDDWLKACICQQLDGEAGEEVDLQFSHSEQQTQTMISTVEKVLYLKNVELFNEIPAEELTSIAEVALEKQFELDDYLIRHGESGNNLHIIIEGRVVIVKEGARVATLKKNDVLGEMSLLTNSPTSADCIAAAPTKTLQINQHDFLDFLYEGYPEIALGLIKVLARRLEKTTAQLDKNHSN